MQNLLVFRFGNILFEPLWNSHYVDNVQITVAEGAVRGRPSRLLRHVGRRAGHGAEPPAADPHHHRDGAAQRRRQSDSLRDRKVDVLKAIRRWTPEEAVANAVAAQYDGYLNEPDVPTGSRTPTYTAMRLFVETWRWHGVPFYLRSGKSMAGKVSEVVVQFRRPPSVISGPDAEVLRQPEPARPVPPA